MRGQLARLWVRPSSSRSPRRRLKGFEGTPERPEGAGSLWTSLFVLGARTWTGVGRAWLESTSGKATRFEVSFCVAERWKVISQRVQSGARRQEARKGKTAIGRSSE